MKYLFILLAMAVVTACAHKPNYQYDCKLVGEDPTNSKFVSVCD